MSAEMIGKFLEEIGTSPKAKEFMQTLSAKTDQEKVDAFIALAKDMGYDLTAEEFKAYIQEKQAAVKEKTDAQAEGIQKVDDDELVKVAGGKKEHSNCKDTYRDYENCLVKDGCDVVNNHYENYQCHSTQQVCVGGYINVLINIFS